jgi:hypothetical protein
VKYNIISLLSALLLAVGLTMSASGTYFMGDSDKDNHLNANASHTWPLEGEAYHSTDPCPSVFNVLEGDADRDGYGNACDADYDNSGGKINATDYATFKASYDKKSTDTGYDEQTNHDCIGKVSGTDFATFKSMFDQQQGPGAQAAGAKGGYLYRAGCNDDVPPYYSNDYFIFEAQAGHALSLDDSTIVPIVAHADVGYVWPDEDICAIRIGLNTHNDLTAVGCNSTTWSPCPDNYTINTDVLPEEWPCWCIRVTSTTPNQHGHYIDIGDGENCIESEVAAFAVEFVEFMDTEISSPTSAWTTPTSPYSIGLMYSVVDIEFYDDGWNEIDTKHKAGQIGVTTHIAKD